MLCPVCVRKQCERESGRGSEVRSASDDNASGPALFTITGNGSLNGNSRRRLSVRVPESAPDYSLLSPAKVEGQKRVDEW